MADSARRETWQDKATVEGKSMFSKVLVANRAEIAVRAFRAAYELGAKTVAVFPHEDRMSEHVELARRCAAEGITFIGPPPEVLAKAGDKVAALKAAREAGVPVLESSEPSRDTDELIAAAEVVGFPIFVKAVAGGGGRGMRRVEPR